MLLNLSVVFVTVNWAEENAWAGFMQARLQKRHGAFAADLITGPVFALGLGTGLLDRLYPGQGTGGLVIPLLAVAGLIVMAAAVGRRGRARTPRTASARRSVTQPTDRSRHA